MKFQINPENDKLESYTCQKCQRHYNTNTSKAHARTHLASENLLKSGITQYHCQKCDLYFKSYHALYMHVAGTKTNETFHGYTREVSVAKRRRSNESFDGSVNSNSSLSTETQPVNKKRRRFSLNSDTWSEKFSYGSVSLPASNTSKTPIDGWSEEEISNHSTATTDTADFSDQQFSLADTSTPNSGTSPIKSSDPDISSDSSANSIFMQQKIKTKSQEGVECQALPDLIFNLKKFEQKILKQTSAGQPIQNPTDFELSKIFKIRKIYENNKQKYGKFYKSPAGQETWDRIVKMVNELTAGKTYRVKNSDGVILARATSRKLFGNRALKNRISKFFK